MRHLGKEIVVHMIAQPWELIECKVVARVHFRPVIKQEVPAGFTLAFIPDRPRWERAAHNPTTYGKWLAWAVVAMVHCPSIYKLNKDIS